MGQGGVGKRDTDSRATLKLLPMDVADEGIRGENVWVDAETGKAKGLGWVVGR